MKRAAELSVIDEWNSDSGFVGHHLATIDTELPHKTISKVVDAVADEVLAWQQRALEVSAISGDLFGCDHRQNPVEGSSPGDAAKH